MHNLTRSKAIIIYLITAGFLVIEMALQIAPSVLIEDLKSSFSIGPYWIGILSSSFSISYILMQLPAGIFFDHFKPRIVIIISSFVCISGSLLFVFAENIWLAMIARFLMGAGSAFAYIGVLVVACDLFDEKYFSSIAGITQLIATFGATCGQIPILLLRDVLGWREAIFTVTIVGIVILFLIYFFVNYQPKILHKSKIERGKLADLLVGIRAILKNVQTWICAGYVCFLAAPMAIFAALFGTTFLQLRSFSSIEAAALTSTMWIGNGLGSLLMSILADFCQRHVFILSLTSFLGFLSFALLLFLPYPNIIYHIILIFLCGVSCGAKIITFAITRSNNKLIHRAVALGFNNMALVMSVIIFQPLVGKLIEDLQTIFTEIKAYELAFSILVLCYLSGFALTFFLKKRN